ncbi:MAG TPA: hypothetical protein VM145_02755 [Sphingomicrobium sp.]|nr:hypothetical protein [Sphingomicrobium sp.]
MADAAAAERSNVPLIAVLVIAALLGSSATIFNDGDVSWHIATGQWILAHRAIPHTDPFSFTWAGRPWVPIEWLAEVLMAGAFAIARYSGVAALVTAALMALHALVFFNAARFVRAWVAVGAVIAMDLVLIPMMLARPHVLAWPLIAFWTWLMLRARQQDRAPPLAAALLMALWANLHGSFVMALVISGAFGVEALAAAPDRGRTIRQWGLFGVACVAAVFINANGIDGVFHPLRIANLAMLPLIDEWKPSNPTVTPVFFLILAATLALLWIKRPKLSWARWLLLGALLLLALLQVRHQAVLAIVTAMILPTGFARVGEEERRSTRWLAAGAIALAVAARAIFPVTLAENETNPWRLIAAIPAELRSRPVLNGYAMGGPLILSGIRPYVDGRGDMYGDRLVVDYKRITDGDAAALNQAVAQWDIRWAILPRRYAKLVALLDRSPGWRRIKEDEAGLIYVRA